MVVLYLGCKCEMRATKRSFKTEHGGTKQYNKQIKRKIHKAIQN